MASAGANGQQPKLLPGATGNLNQQTEDSSHSNLGNAESGAPPHSTKHANAQHSRAQKFKIDTSLQIKVSATEAGKTAQQRATPTTKDPRQGAGGVASVE